MRKTDSKIKDGAFYVITAEMVKELGLKDVELAIYAIIYGFTQDGENIFTGSLTYLAEWTGKSKECICRNLKSLVDKGLLMKEETTVNGIKTCSYKCVRGIDLKSTVLMQNQQGIDSKSMGVLILNQQGIDLKSTNNKYNNKLYIYYRDIVEFLNEKAGTKYSPDSKQTQKLIDARMKEGFTVDDFKKVIETKCSEWLKDKKMCTFLRPSTLFGTKFEQYLGQRTVSKGEETSYDMKEFEDRARKLPVYTRRDA